VRGTSVEPLEANGALLSIFSDAEKRSLYTGWFGGRMLDVDSLNLLRRFLRRRTRSLDDVLYADLCLALPDDLLAKVDVAAMAWASKCGPRSSRAIWWDLASRSRRAEGRPAPGQGILRRAYAAFFPRARWRGARPASACRWTRGCAAR